MTHSYSADGYGDRDDMALERSRSEGAKTENFYNDFYRSIPDAEYSETGRKVKDIFMAMLRNNSMCALYAKEQIAPFEDLHEEFSDAWCALVTEMDLDEEESYNPSILDTGDQVEFRLV